MIAPYYQDDHVTLYHGDCLEIDAWLSADVLVTDPPYGIGWNEKPGWKNALGSGGTRSSGTATSITNDHNLDARNNAINKWGNNPGIVFGDVLKPAPANTVQMLIYAKPVDAGIRGAHAGRRRDIEAIFLTGKWPVTVGGKSSILTTNGRVAGPRGMGLRAGHPHAKPIDLLEELIQLGTFATIADPFAGSGSTLLAARNLGRKSIGVEIEEQYCELIAKRLSHQTFDFGDWDGAA